MNLPNYTQIPNQFIETEMASLNGSAVKVFLAICRKTIGWHKACDSISYSQLEKLTGLGSEAIKDALTVLTNPPFKLVNVESSPGKTNRFDLNLSTTSSESEEVREPTSSKSEEVVFENRRGTSSKSEETKETPKETPQNKPIPPKKISLNREKADWDGITEADDYRWQQAFPAVDLKQEGRSAALWCIDNPAKGAKHDYRRFLTNWFRRCQERGGTKGYISKKVFPRPLSRYAPPEPLSDDERKENIGQAGELLRKLASKRVAVVK